ncbi:hypothetical protein [Acidianus ambivalens]|uniref:Uncharacterized protein n=1 Tax=Acidianus ambivalens TaxID=2283 RepID=A0A650CTE5_ACIAM|nr:hypothetical protein [Acidianus ambivalens]MQL56493.1 hypothetical protein [Acidianus ambivalens]QGR21124.1 hypothetical protein D1866_03185 [Acidianus ambivalens]
MENYQVLGIVGSVLLLVAFVIPFYMGYYFMGGYYGGMMGGMMGGYPHRAIFFAFPVIMALPALVLGLIGSLISDRQIGGVLLIIAAVLSIPVFFGFFGISFILLLIAGILALTQKK